MACHRSRSNTYELSLKTKRALALREFALELEALARCVAGESQACVHECVFAVLALETEPLDLRL